MKLGRIISLLILLLPCLAAGQDIEKSVNDLSGDMELLSEDDYLAVAEFCSSPLPLNSLSAAALAESGLFSAYQAASIIDYRSLHGDILSGTELGLLDGFNPYLASKLSPLLSFEPTSVRPSGMRVSSAGRLWYKDGGASWGYRSKIALAGGKEAGFAAKPSSYSFYAGFRIGRSRFVLGDFNLRFGQGLALWNGMSFTGVSTPLSLSKRASALSGSTSYSGLSYRGAAWEYRRRKTITTTFACYNWQQKKYEAGVNVSRLLRHGQIGFTSIGRRGMVTASVDGRFCFSGRDLFFEAALNTGTPVGYAVCAGTVFPLPAKGSRLAVMARCFSPHFDGADAAPVRSWSESSDELGASVSFGRGDCCVSLDAARKSVTGRRLLKLRAYDIFKMGKWKLKAYLQYRWKNYGSDKYRSEVRLDFCRDAGLWQINTRINAVRSIKTGILSYSEVGYLPEEHSKLWLRATVFRADNWYDRLYSYERDAPGNFLVPFYYGRGYSLSTYVVKKLTFNGRGRLGIYLRAAYNGFFRDSQRKKPGSLELRLSVTWTGF